MKTLAVVTTSRADYGIYRPLLTKILEEKTFKLALLVSGTHLSKRFGATVREIERDRMPIRARIPILTNGDGPAEIGAAMAAATKGFSSAYRKRRPDLVIVLGDRYEMHAAAVATIPFLIPMIHIAGGFSTEGAIDDSFRHSMTKLAHLHFVETESYGRAVVTMGEERWRVSVTGALGLDNLSTLSLYSFEELRRIYRFPFTQAPLVVTFHGETKSQEPPSKRFSSLLSVLSRARVPVVFTAPNADTGGRIIRAMIEKFVLKKKDAVLVDSFGTQKYFSLMKHAAAMVGNSSSGIVEAPSFGLPVVNIGDRQKGRLMARNVITTGAGANEIDRALRKALAPRFRSSLRSLKNPYGDGHAAERMMNVLKRIKFDERLLRKKLVS